MTQSSLTGPIGLFGGTFDPIHLGHLRTAWETTRALALAQLRFIPCSLPPHRIAPQTSAHHRCEMVKQAIENIPSFMVDDREIRRGGISYTIDTLHSLRQELPSHSLCLIVGRDAFMSFMDWHAWEDIIKLVNVVVIHRPGHQEPFAAHLLNAFELVTSKEALAAHTAGALYFQPVTSLAISATQIRQEILREQNARFLITDKVGDYIFQNHLYQITEE